MHIDKYNFSKQINNILKQLQKAEFISFDCQFSGLKTRPQHGQHQFQSQQQYYQRIKQNCSSFCLFQIGICIFSYEEKQYLPKCYNFYIKSNSNSKKMSNMIIAQMECLQFLAKHKMDFNKIFLQGVQSYQLSRKQQLKQNLQKKQQQQQELRKQDYTFLCEKDDQLIKGISLSIKEDVINLKKEIKINFQNKLIFKEIRKNFPNIFFDKKNNMQQNQYVVRPPKPQKNAAKTIKATKPKTQQKNIQQKLGFSLIIQKIIKHKIPIIGHFPSLDIAFIYHNFIADLPDTFQEYCKELSNCFQYFFDTKVISKRIQSSLKNIRTDLSSLYSACSDVKLLGPYTNINYKYVKDYEQQSSAHEAGYDAFLTGCVFIGMINFINKDKKTNKIQFHQIESNKTIYSKYSQQIKYNGIVSNKFQKSILVIQNVKSEQKIKNIGNFLRKYGNVKICLRDKIYIQYENEVDLAKIIQDSKNQQYQILLYKDRNQFKAKKIFDF